MQKIQSGDVIQLPLLKDLGYCLAKYALTEDFIEEKSIYSHRMLFVYHYLSETEFDKEGIEKALSSDLLVSPLLLNGKPKRRGDNKIKMLGNYGVKDCFIPEYKDYNKTMISPYIEDSKQYWSYISDLKFDSLILSSYEKVKHLEHYMISSYDVHLFRITLEWLWNLDIPIEKYFDITSMHDAYQCMYEWSRHTPRYWTIPKNIRGKAIR